MVYLIKIKLLFVFFVLRGSLYAQNSPYYFSHQVDSMLQADSTPFRYQTASWNYSFTGNYKMALEVRDLQYPGAKPVEPTQEQAELFAGYKPVDAKKYILKEAGKRKVLVINEAHHVGLHRVFMSSLLKDLYRLGYTFIGMEALSVDDSLLNKRGYPVLNSGYYTHEPCFGNLLRTAVETGFTVFPYEQNNREQASMHRDKVQALNIKMIMDRNPDAKFIIYCGYDHLVEDTLKNFMGLPMAGQLKALTGIDPLTIDQTLLTECFMTGSRYRKLIRLPHDALFTDSLNRLFNQASLPKAVDGNLYHPNTVYINNRPSWLNTASTRLVLLHNRIQVSYPCLVKVYLETDDISNAVPVDVVELQSAKDQTASVLMKGKRHIVTVVNTKGEKQVLSNVR